MTHIEYFKRQAKNFFKDYKAKASYIDNLLLHYRFDQNDFSLMKAQHIVALMGGFSKWTDLVKSSEIELELAKLLFENQDKIPIDHWKNYISAIERDHGINFDAETRLEVFKHDFEITFGSQSNGRVTENKPQKTPKPTQNTQIILLPLSKEDRMEFIEAGKQRF